MAALMTERVARKVEELRGDFTAVRGESFKHFYCPILFTDEVVELCEAHIINRVFPDSSRAWTVQRKDVDGWYGSMFEADFLLTRFGPNVSALDVLLEPRLRQLVQPRLLLNGERVDYYVPGDGPIACTGPCRTPIPEQAEHPFRRKPNTDSGPFKQPVGLTDGGAPPGR